MQTAVDRNVPDFKVFYKWFSTCLLSPHTVAYAHCVCHRAKLSCQAESQKTLFFFFWRKLDYFENVSGLGGNIGFSGWQAESFPWWGDISRSLAHHGVFRWQAEALLNRELLKQLGHKLWRQNGGCSPNEVCLLLTCSLHSGISSVNCGFPLIVTLKEDISLFCRKGTQFWHQQTHTVQELGLHDCGKIPWYCHNIIKKW